MSTRTTHTMQCDKCETTHGDIRIVERGRSYITVCDACWEDVIQFVENQ